jgi:hypothetical protein
VPYLDCYHPAALLGDEFPVNSYGPASQEQLADLAQHIAHNFQRMEIVSQTKGQNPLPADLWPGVSRPR